MDLRLTLTCLGFVALFAMPCIAEEPARKPHNFADCLFREKATPGEWVKYHVEVTNSTEEDGKEIEEKEHYELRTSLVPIEEDPELHWLEASWRKKNAKDALYIVKNLVDLKAPNSTEEGWINEERPIGWEMVKGKPVTEFSEETILKRPYLAALLMPTSAEFAWKEADLATEDTGAGKIRCAGFFAEDVDGFGEGAAIYRFHESVPFGCVLLSATVERDDIKFSVVLQVSDHGNGAQSELPSHGYAELARHLESQEN